VPAAGRFAAVGFSADPELTFAPWESFAAESLMTCEEIGVYAEARPSGDPVIHRLLGHPDPVQGDMQLECQLAANGVYCGDGRTMGSHLAHPPMRIIGWVGVPVRQQFRVAVTGFKWLPR
jgi:hypothetical protein